MKSLKLRVVNLESGRIYKIKNVKAGTVLDKSGPERSSITGWEDYDGDNQKWVLEQARGTNGWWFRHRSCGKYLAIALGSCHFAGNDTALIVRDQPFAWEISPDEEVKGGYRIYLPGGRAPGLNVDLSEHGNPYNGTRVTLWEKWHGSNQVWFFELLSETLDSDSSDYSDLETDLMPRTDTEEDRSDSTDSDY